MANYDFPDICPNETEWGLLTNTRSHTSPLTGAITTSGRRGTRWFTRMTFTNLRDDQRRELQAHLVRLNGQTHRSMLFDWSYQASYGAGGGANVNGGGQTGSTLNIFPSANWGRNGDYFLLNGELKMITDDFGSGAATQVSFTPPLRTAPPDGALLSQARPMRIPMILIGNDTSWANQPDTSLNNSATFSVEFVEDINL